jgi:hypothetical protein
MWNRSWWIFVCLNFVASAQQNSGQAVLGSIQVQSTHLPAASIVRLLGLQVGQAVNSNTLSAASDRVLATGLVADITYSYLPQSNPARVAVVAKLWDEKPLLPATIFPSQNETAMWSCLQASDPIFLQELPNTRNALLFYVANMNKCIAATSNQSLHAVAKVICDPNLKPARIEFRIEPGPQPDQSTQNGATSTPPNGSR